MPGNVFAEKTRGSEGSAADEQTFGHVFADDAEKKKINCISDDVTEQLALPMSVDAGSIVIAVELCNLVMRRFDAPLQSTETLANRAIQTLAESNVTRFKNPMSDAARGRLMCY